VWHPNLTQMNSRLADRYPALTSVRRILTQAGLETRRLVLESDASAIDRWFDVLQKLADSLPSLRAIADVVDGENPQAGLRELIDALPTAAETDADAATDDLRVGPARVRPVPNFVGRGAVLDELATMLAPREDGDLPGVVLVGLGGIGKTQVAARYAADASAARRFDHIAWLHADTRDKLERDLGAFGREQLGVHADAEDGADQIRLTIGRLEVTTQSWLLVLDNVEDQAMLSGLLPGTGNGAVLITSRKKSLRSSFRTIEITPLTADECAEHMLTVNDSDDREGALELAAALGGLPLAMAHATAYIHKTKITFGDYLAELDRLPARELLRSDPTEFYKETVASTWRRSVVAATKQAPEASNLLDKLSFLDPDNIPRRLVDGPAAAAVADLDRAQLRDAAGALHDYSLIGLTQSGAQIHRLVQRVTLEDAVECGRAVPAAAFLTQLLVRSLNEIDSSSQSWSEFVALRPQVIALIGHSVQKRIGIDELAESIAALGPLAVRNGLRAAAASPIEQVGQTREAIESIVALHRMDGGAGPRGHTAVVLNSVTSETTDHNAAAKAGRAIIERGDERDVAALVLLSVEKRQNAVQLLAAVAHAPRVSDLLRAHPDWAASVRFICQSPTRDPTLTALEAGVAAKDDASTRVWLRILLDRSSRPGGLRLSAAQIEAKLRRYAPNHEAITLALAGLLEKTSVADALDVLDQGQHLGPGVPVRLAQLLLANDQRESALRTLRRFAPKSADSALELAKLIELEDFNEARGVLTRFANIDARSAITLAKMIRRRLDTDEAGRVLAGYARRWPAVAIVLSRIRRNSGDVVGAASALKPHANEPIVAKEIDRLVTRTKMRDPNYDAMLAVLRAKRAKVPPMRPKPDAPRKPQTEVLFRVRDLVEAGDWWGAVAELNPGGASDIADERRTAVTRALESLIRAKDGALVLALLRGLAGELSDRTAVSLIKRVAEFSEAQAIAAAIDPYRELARTDAALAISIADIEEEVGDRDAALRTLGAVQEPTRQVALTLAEVYDDARDPESAIEALRPFLPDPAVVKRIGSIASAAGRPDLAIAVLRGAAPESPAVERQISRLTMSENLTGEADFEWFYGDADRAVELLRPHAVQHYRAGTRLIEMLCVTGRRDEALALAEEWLRANTRYVMLYAEVAAETGGIDVAARVLEPYIAGNYEAATALSWLASRAGRVGRAREYLEAHVRVRANTNQMSQILAETGESAGKASRLARLLRRMGCFGHAEDLLRAYPYAVPTQLELADLLRVRLEFPEGRAVLDGLARTHDAGALLLAGNWLRNGNLTEAAGALRAYRGSKSLQTPAHWIRYAYDNAGAAARIARCMLDAGLYRCAFEMTQVTKHTDDQTLAKIRTLPGMQLTQEEQNAVARVRTRALIRDRKLTIVVRPDFRLALRERFHRSQIGTIAAAAMKAGKAVEPGDDEPDPTPEETVDNTLDPTTDSPVDDDADPTTDESADDSPDR